MHTWGQDVRYGLRVLGRNPGFTAMAVLILALGIGATTAIFSVVNDVMLKRLPFSTADRLVRIRSVIAATGQGGIASYPDFLDWQAQNHVFDAMAVFRTNDFTLIGPHEPQHLQGAVVSAQLFSLLGVTPTLGRGFLPVEDRPAATNGTDPVILSYGLWQREFGSDASLLGRTIQLGNQPFTVVGVMPRSFQFPVQAEPIELWTTVAIDARGGMTEQRGTHYLDVIGLRKEPVTLEQAQVEMVTITAALNKQHPEVKARTVRIVPEIQALVGPLRLPLLVLLGAVGCVLLVVCANVANLLLARAAGRHKEMAIRAVLGASRRRAVCQLLTESVVLGLLGGVLGLALALNAVKSFVLLMPSAVPRLNAVALDSRVLGFSISVSLLAGILFGLAPALRVSKIDLSESLKRSGASLGSEGQGRSRLRDALVMSEVALASILLPIAALLVQSFLHLTRVDPGFDPHRVLTFQMDSPPGRERSQVPAFFREVVAQTRTLAGVTATSAVASLPLTGDNIRSSIEIEGQPTPIGSRPTADFNSVEPDYFRTLGITFLAGRDFTERDDSSSTPVVIVNRVLARRFFPGQNPIGKHVRPGIANGYGPGEPPMREIVGVIGDVKQGSLGMEAAPEVYAPLAQSPFGTFFIVARIATDPRNIIEAARHQVASLDKRVPIYHVETLDQYFAQSVALPGFVTLLLSGFAAFAVLLACLGVYGVMSYMVARRTHEIGIRMALGARRADVLKLVIGQGSKPMLMGLAIGVSGALALTRFLSTLLYGIRPTDPLTFFLVALILAAATLIASYVPARRATRVDPLVALRYE